jgi:PAS domain S-box-containing protein
MVRRLPCPSEALKSVSFHSLRARAWIAISGAVLCSGTALTVCARHLIRLHERIAPHDATFVRDAWASLGIVALSALIAVVATVLVTTSHARRQLAAVRAAILSRPTTGALHHRSMPTASAHASDELNDVYSAIAIAHSQQQLALSRIGMELDRHRAMIDVVFASVFAVDGGGRIISANPAAVRMFALPLDSLHGVVLSDLIAADSLRMAIDEFGSITFSGDEHDRRFTTRMRLFGRRSFPADVSVTPLALDGQRAWAVFVHDLTDKQQSESALDAARVAAESANRAKTAFLARMSHELRTPLNAVSGFTNIVRRSRSSQLSERDRQSLDRVQTASEHLLVLVSDILDLSRIESGTIELSMERIDVTPIVRDILSHYENAVADRPVVLEYDLQDGDALATVDAARLRQVLTNLIGNAIKFTARGSVRVAVRRDQETGHAIAIIVRDTGIGIPLERQAHIFESFEQGGEETSHRYGGTGLGLALSRRIAQQMGCMLSVESMPGAGSTFALAFNPVNTAPVAASRLFQNDAA